MPWQVALQGPHPAGIPRPSFRPDGLVEPHRYSRPTRLNLRTEILRHLGDSINTWWSNAEINQYIQEGYDHLCLATELLWTKASPASLQDVLGQPTYALPADLYQIERITNDQKRLIPLNRREAEGHDPIFETQQGDQIAYLVEGDGIRILRKIHVPNATYTGATSEGFDQAYVANKTSIEYTKRGAAVGSDSSTFEIPSYYLKYLRWYALARALEREGPGQDLLLSQHYQGRYNDGIARIRRRKVALHGARVHRLGGTTERRDPDSRWRLPSNYPRVPRY